MYDELEEFFAPADPDTFDVKFDFADYMARTGYASTLTTSSQTGTIPTVVTTTSSSSGTTTGGAIGITTTATNAPLITTSVTSATITTGPTNITTVNQPNSSGATWISTPNIGGSGGTGISTYPYGGGSISTSPYVLPASGGTWNITYPGMLYPGQEAWPQVIDAIGIVFIDGDLIKIKSKNGKEVIIGRLDDSSEDIIPIEVVAAKKKLLEGTKEEQLG